MLFMNVRIATVFLLLSIIGSISCLAEEKLLKYAGSRTCVRCHEHFYELWKTSHHGLAMQPYTEAFSETLAPQANEIEISGSKYIFDLPKGQLFECHDGMRKTYPASYVLGGKYVYYFLTKLDRGQLQTLPVGYDVNKRQWFDVAGSGIGHLPEGDAISWKDPFYTFNTSCYGCHVSQLELNYTPEKSTYQTSWTEPGINCETCHGPAKKHNQVCDVPSVEQLPRDLKIIRGGRNGSSVFSADQQNSSCGSCHAKMIPLSSSFPPGKQFFDFYDLVTLEHPDFYPDGRDLGENYTYTSWMMSPCVANSDLDCLHCHTSSGRYRFSSEDKANHDCLPCHRKKVNNPTPHTHHKASQQGGPHCTSCHMPKTTFARMHRSDHSMRPPTPAAGILYGSPIACLSCHAKKNAQWADKQVSAWSANDFQVPYLDQAKLVKAARNQDWSHLDGMLEYISRPGREVVVANSLIRLLHGCRDDRKWNVLLAVMQNDPSPLLRASAAAALGEYLTQDVISALAEATNDAFRLVRIRAAASLAPVPESAFTDEKKRCVQKATGELISALLARSDDYSSHYSLGNLYMDRGEYRKAIVSFQEAQRLRPDYLPPFVNAALAYNALGKYKEAEKSLHLASVIAPESSAVYLNLGLLYGEQRRFEAAEAAFRQALSLDINLASAAYNLGVLLEDKNPLEALSWLRKAVSIAPDILRYRYTLAYVEEQIGNVQP
ncbi:tetratricopeptide repeat protein [Desulfosarcina ovata]|uniref:Cytochrome c-552/4 domain-containing protein n=1 Tax=Desulfosarcina ovata subsp. ovata TaxID=2752305 RepID=A0A5K8AFN2_9BACT|nr:tetratricopeptide repeat protein [Desulfosarcina ovata]BBO90724.1 hypothetical protein DSCOOX_39040 [Desulfosarcina ovata subsp. ovata]